MQLLIPIGFEMPEKNVNRQKKNKNRQANKQIDRQTNNQFRIYIIRDEMTRILSYIDSQWTMKVTIRTSTATK